MITLTDRCDRPSDIPLAFVELPQISVDTSVHFSNELFAHADLITPANIVSTIPTITFNSNGVINPNNDLNNWSSSTGLVGYNCASITSGTFQSNVGVAIGGSGDPNTARYGYFEPTGALSTGTNTHLLLRADFGYNSNPTVYSFAQLVLLVYVDCYDAADQFLSRFIWKVEQHTDFEPVSGTLFQKYSNPITLPPNTSKVRIKVYPFGKPVEGFVLTRFDVEAGTLARTSSSITPEVHRKLQKPIVIQRIVEDSGGGWYPVISDGIVYRSFVLPANEPASSWLWSYFNVGDELVLVYTVPEIHWRSVNGNRDVIRMRENALVTEDRVIRLRFRHIVSIERLYDGKQYLIDSDIGFGLTKQDALPSGISYIDWETGEIGLRTPPGDESKVYVVYTCREHGYIYTGGVDDRLDLNPSPGHVITYRTTGGVQIEPSSKLITSGVAIYLVPVAAYYASGFPSPSAIRRPAGMTRAVYHALYSLGEDSRMPLLRSISTYGYAQYDISTYSDTVTTSSSPIIPFTSLPDWPSTLIIGNIIVEPGYGFQWASVWDCRRRGGGLLESIPDNAPEIGDVRHHLWDIGGWDGMPVSRGGAVTVKLPASLLQQYSKQEVESLVRRYVAAGVEVHIEYT